MLKRNRGDVALCAAGLVIVLFLTGCAGANSQAILDLVPLQAQLAAQYGGAEIAVDLHNGNRLGITVAGSLPDDLGNERGVEQAREIARTVCQHYASIDRIDQVRVAFQDHQVGILVDGTSLAAFTFEKGEFGCGGK